MPSICLRTDGDLPPFIPPTSWSGHRIYPGSCRCFTGPLVMANLAEMDPMVAAGFHNLTCSPLCRLPEELLLDIMQRLDLVSIQSLRRVSRLFIRLFCSPTFRNTCGSTCELLSFEHWYNPKSSLCATWSPKLQAILDRDIGGYCDDCRGRRTDPNWISKKAALTTTYLHCSGCRIDHPVCLFSKTQRSMPSRTWVCIGKEGFVRVCEHRVVTWKELIGTGQQLAKLDTKLASIFLDKCRHESHFPKHHQNDTCLLRPQVIYPAIELCGCLDGRVFVEFTC